MYGYPDMYFPSHYQYEPISPHQEYPYPGMSGSYHQPVYGAYKQSFMDHGKQPYTIDINRAAKQNNTFRTAIWTGTYLQVTLMSIPPGSDVGLEMHRDVDQFLRIEQGQALVRMGSQKDRLDYQQYAYDDSAVMVPARTWHNVINIGHQPLKLYSIYAPPEHPYGTVHSDQATAFMAEDHHN